VYWLDLGSSSRAESQIPIHETELPFDVCGQDSYPFRREHLKDAEADLYYIGIERDRLPVGVMKKLGVVDNLSYDGSILVRADFAPGRGAQVVDAKKNPVGRIFKVFGPVKKPFAAVRPSRKVSLSLIGSEVYLEEGEHAEKPKKGRRS
jgi:RNA-binding protein